jgi:hypothetical protein
MKTCFALFAMLLAAVVVDRESLRSGDLAAPRIIMLYGGALDRRLYLTRFPENLQFMSAVAEPATLTRDALRGRPFIEVALYWHGPTWEPYATDTALLKTLRPEAGQPARLYLGKGRLPPLFDYYSAGVNSGLRTIDPAGLAILKRHKVIIDADRRPR